MARSEYDLAIVGAGIVGLGAALAASKTGAKVVVLESEPRVLGASVQNFGHLGPTLQSGAAAEYAYRSRELWLGLCDRAGIWYRQGGATVVLRGDDELALMEEVQAEREPGRIELRNREATLAEIPIADPRLIASAVLCDDLQVDPRAAVPTLAEYVAELGVEIRFGAHVQGIESGTVHLAQGSVAADRVLLAVNTNVDRFFPELAAEHGLRRCMLDMIGLDWSRERPVPMPVLTASSLLRYSASTSSVAGALRDRLATEMPEFESLDINEMYTNRPDGMLVVGDTHRLGDASEPFQPERSFEVLLKLAQALYGVDQPRVLQRWQGVYAKANDPFLRAEPLPGVRVLSVTTGIGMTTGLGFAERAIQEW